jgi:hypothetical protein
MAKLEDLYTDFLSLTPNMQEMAFLTYAQRRQEDLLSGVRFVTKKPRKATTETIQLTDAEKKLMKSLGLKQSDLVKLRTSIAIPEDEDDEDEGELEVE